MPIANERTESLLHAQFRAIQASLARTEPQDSANPVSQVLTGLMKHGGLYTLLDSEMMTARLSPVFARNSSEATAADASAFVSSLGNTVGSFFSHLVNGRAYTIPSSLMSHLAIPGAGTLFSDPAQEQSNPAQFESPDIPAAFTFVGQFIDHDLTMNAVNLFEPQTGDIRDTASPLIDLDSAYGPRTLLTSPSKDIYNHDGSFKLADRGGYFDLTRDKVGNAYISDKRNDENQLVLQVHLLVMRLHNKLIKAGRSFKDAYLETLFNWQSVVLTDYLPRLIQPQTLTFLLAEIAKPDFGAFKHKPCRDLATGQFHVSMPHEFAIGFRFGHSQLRFAYQMNPASGFVRLFDNSLTSSDAHNNVFSDLRGSQELVAAHVIDWPTFLGGANPIKSNRIDGKVTSVAFDLPESTIPDDIKYVGNLPHRNLIRSRQVGVCAGEDLADFYGIPRLSPDQVETDSASHNLYMDHGRFRTPLWVYLLKEAEVTASATISRLGKLGSRLVGEVLIGGIAYAPNSVMNNPAWKSSITGSRDVSLLQLAEWVNS
jgi:hypothetical protein